MSLIDLNKEIDMTLFNQLVAEMFDEYEVEWLKETRQYIRYRNEWKNETDKRNC